METFILGFILLSLVMAGMSLGVMFAGKTIKGSCGGLNAIADADKCLVCHKDVDPDSPLRDRLACRKAMKIREELEKEIRG